MASMADRIAYLAGMVADLSLHTVEVRLARLLLAAAPEGALVLPDYQVLEMKFLYAMPVKFKYVVEEFALIPQRFSKYRLAASALGLAVAREAPEAAVPQPDSSLCLIS